MLVDSSIRTGDKNVDDYIASLEGEVLSFSASNSRKLIRSIDNMAKKISNEMDLISKDQRNDDDSEVDISGKHVDIYLKMVEKVDRITNFIKVVESMDDAAEEVASAAPEEPEQTIAPVKGEPINMFERKQIEKMKEKGTFRN